MAQKYERFYDIRWNKTEPANARYYSVVEKKDSVWVTADYFIHEKALQMSGSCKDSACKIKHGDFRYYYASGALESTGRYVNNKKDGLWLRFYNNGVMRDSTTYDLGNATGTSMGWYKDGYLSDSIVYNADGSGMVAAWFNNGSPSASGRLSAGYKKSGKWQYFHRNGELSALELYVNDKLTDKQYFDEQGNPEDTTYKDREAAFPGGPKAWHNYALKKLYFPPGYNIQNADKVTVVVSAIIDEDGNVTEALVTNPFHPAFDKIALDIIKKSPKWIPAISHNRRVQTSIKQPVVFGQTSD